MPGTVGYIAEAHRPGGPNFLSNSVQRVGLADLFGAEVPAPAYTNPFNQGVAQQWAADHRAATGGEATMAGFLGSPWVVLAGLAALAYYAIKSG